MWASLREYHRPKTIGAALKILARTSPRTIPLAGGAWLVARRDPSIQAVVDLSGLNLAFVEKSARRVRLGAMTTLQTLVEHPLVQEVGGSLLSDASRQSAPLSIRNVATLGGTMVVGEGTSEVLLALLALDARVVIRSPLRLEITLEAFLAGRPAQLTPHALISEVYLPTLPRGSGTALKEISRTPRDRPIVNAAAVVVRKRQTCRMARLALGGIGPHPIRLPDIEAAISLQKIDEPVLTQVADTISSSINSLSDTRASIEYRRKMAGIVVARALQQAWEQTESE